MFHFPFYLLFCPCLYITFAMLLGLVCVCLSITFIVRNIFVLRTHGTYTSHTCWDIRPYTRVYVRHKEWRSIYGHVGSPTCLITVKPHLEFYFFGDALSLIVPIATMYYLRTWYLWRPVATYPTMGVRAKSQRSVFQKGKCAGVATNIYSRKTLEKPKRGLQILKRRVSELFMHGEGINTPRARC